MDQWVEREVAGCSHMRDARLKKRLGEVLTRLAEQPTQSIPSACHGWAETQAAYRFFDNERVAPEDILEGHGRATLERVAAEPVVLVVQDTTFLEYLKDRLPKGLGTASREAADGVFAASERGLHATAGEPGRALGHLLAAPGRAGSTVPRAASHRAKRELPLAAGL